MKIAVLGAGVSGLTVAKKLQDSGHEVTVYEQASKPGGLAKTRVTDGYLYDPYGGHIFNSKHSQIVDWVFSLLPKDKWHFSVRNAKIFFNGKYVSYPFELSLCELDTAHTIDCAHDFMLSQQGPEPSNFKDWLIWNFGQSIADYYMLPYNEKIWAYPLEQMETTWMRGKMPMPTKKEMLSSLLMNNPSERKMPHSTFYYPIEGGIQSMVDAIATGLNIQLSTPITSIKQQDENWIVNESDIYEQVVSTIPLPVLNKVMQLPQPVSHAIDGLKYNSLTTMLCSCPSTDISWLYIPSREYKSHRVCYESALTPRACSSGGSGAIEVIGEKFTVDKSTLNEQRIVPPDLKLGDIIDSDFTEYAYVVHDLAYGTHTQMIKGYFSTVNSFELLGRFATWNYKNMDLCMLDAFELAENINRHCV